MRTIRFYVIHKITREVVYTNCDENKCKLYLAGMLNSKSYCVGYKWLSI